MFILKLKAIVDRNFCNSFFVIAARRIDVVFARTEIRRPLIRARFAKRISPLSVALRQYICVHDDKVARTAAHHEQMKYLMAAEILVLQIE